MKISYEGKTVIVTGAAGGLGKAMSRLFACTSPSAVCRKGGDGTCFSITGVIGMNWITE